MKEHLHIIQRILPAFEKEQMEIPFKEAGIDSLDLVVIRVALEKYFGFELSDAKWYECKTLAEAIVFFQKEHNKSDEIICDPKKIECCRELEIRMPQMANSALSENWLLKEIGDMHWELLSNGLEQKSSEFKDDSGNRLYATFVRINYSLSPLNLFLENEALCLNMEIKRFGKNTYHSAMKGRCGEKIIVANLMTNFSRRQLDDNSKISKGDPFEMINHIPEVTATPEFLNEYRLLKKGLLSNLNSGDFNFKVVDDIIGSGQYLINPFYEINGVGLLYFASYPIIADKCFNDFLTKTGEIKNLDYSYNTIYRDIFYFANCNASDEIIFKINRIDHLGENRISVSSSLYRKSDNTLMARIFTVKEIGRQPCEIFLSQ